MKRAVLPRSRMLLMMMNIKRDVLRRRIYVEVERGVIVLTQRRADYGGDRDCTDIRRAGVFQPLKQARLDVTDDAMLASFRRNLALDASIVIVVLIMRNSNSVIRLPEPH